jgi:hypothetical protein
MNVFGTAHNGSGVKNIKMTQILKPLELGVPGIIMVIGIIALTTDDHGHVFVSDYLLNSIQVFTSNGSFVTKFGS